MTWRHAILLPLISGGSLAEAEWKHSYFPQNSIIFFNFHYYICQHTINGIISSQGTIFLWKNRKSKTEAVFTTRKQAYVISKKFREKFSFHAVLVTHWLPFMLISFNFASVTTAKTQKEFKWRQAKFEWKNWWILNLPSCRNCQPCFTKSLLMIYTVYSASKNDESVEEKAGGRNTEILIGAVISRKFTNYVNE